jgi:hypothetical protein
VDADHEAATDEVVADGVVQQVSYGGATSRIVVRLAAGPDITLLQRNETFQDAGAGALTGRDVRVAWARRHAVRLPDPTAEVSGTAEPDAEPGPPAPPGAPAAHDRAATT